jgi:tetratricopeptide (TPR) repeat protein
VQDCVDGLNAALDRIAAGDPAQAEAICRGLLDADPGNQACLLLLGLALGAQGVTDQAQPLLLRVAHQRASGQDPRYELAGVLVRLRCRPLVAALYRECLLRMPDDAKLRYCLAEFLHEASALREAALVLTEGLRRHPDWVSARQLLGIVYADLGQFGAAIGQFRQVVTQAPEQAGGWGNLGVMLKIEGRFDAALKAYDRAIALAPQDARIRVNRTVALLHAGRLEEAWPEFEWRLALPEHRGMGVDRLMPPLSRLGDVTGRTVLVTHEDGFGDTVQFMRYVPLLAQRGARVIAWVPKPLERVLRSVAGVAEVLTGDIPFPPFDWHCPFVSLPRVFETSLATIPNAVPYISVDAESVQLWRARLPTKGMLVGLVWAGQVRPHLPGFDVVDARRSTKLATFAPLAAVEGARFISLQIGPAADQAKTPPSGLKLCDPMGGVADFADTAAIIANLDVVVSVDTSVAHLAGAMGKPVLLLDRYDNCWRWLSGRTDSPWYPTLRIFRQKRLYEWDPVIVRVVTALNAMAKAHAARANRPYPPRRSRDAARCLERDRSREPVQGVFHLRIQSLLP